MHWQSSGTWERIHKKILKKLHSAKRQQHEVAIIDSTLTGAFGVGAKRGSDTVDSAKPGNKYTLLVDANDVSVSSPSGWYERAVCLLNNRLCNSSRSLCV